MKVLNAFSKFADEYNKYNVIQKDVAQKLCTFLDKKSYKKILDIGAGDGAIFENISKRHIEFSNFVALDFSAKMLAIHQDAFCVKKICLDFNEEKLSQHFLKNEFDLIISSSALQWSNNLTNLLSEIALLSDEFLFSFFTANTFKTLHSTININSPILTKEEILEALNQVFNYEVELIEYQLPFDSVHDMLRYIKKSGVSGGVKQLDYKAIKSLMLKYPLDYLEFEVVFVRVIGKK
ncbi:MAG: Biotin synthesis protein BioC [uncultured Sulfurovum sp.]|uniref:Biotin synthesis protein BioC n=1 Tax=uncultured Sulfurovum sp. TaxID=269237 RepID=A0A6S6UC84_9BACT|nr:MAG: Biotin synthesis protein BioC [uncultured Sulfurovum sp.]